MKKKGNKKNVKIKEERNEETKKITKRRYRAKNIENQCI